jgi:hypothetical protein
MKKKAIAARPVFRRKDIEAFLPQPQAESVRQQLPRQRETRDDREKLTPASVFVFQLFLQHQ